MSDSYRTGRGDQRQRADSGWKLEIHFNLGETYWRKRVSIL